MLFPKAYMWRTPCRRWIDLTFKPGKVFADCSGCPTMVVVGPGSFTQGAESDDPMAKNSEWPARRVRIGKMFAMGVYEVTFSEWDGCWQDNVCPPAGDLGWGRGRRPVINVDWDGANLFTQWLR